MKERPILFSGPMVRAILEGRKTQTRRVLKPQPISNEQGGALVPLRPSCPYGYLDDRLWVRESFQPLYLDKFADGYEPGDIDYKTGKGYQINYVATDGVAEFYDESREESFSSRITPSIFMPRWASRITLEIIDVRVQRVKDVSAEDAITEGIPAGTLCPVVNFSELWNSINAKRGFGWETNPWVWAITFRRIGS